LSAEAMETVVESGQTVTQSHVALFNQALAAAHLGRVEEARSWGTEGLRRALLNDDLFNATWHRAVLGFLELSLGRAAEAHEHLEPAVRYLGRMGSAEPAIIPCVPDEVEALVALGRLDEAEPLVDRLEQQGRGRDRPWALAAAGRCRGLMAAARGELGEALAAVEKALDEHRRVAQPFEHARSMFVLGQIQRRRKQKRAARDALHDARDTFSELGALPWTVRADAELARIGGPSAPPLDRTRRNATCRQVLRGEVQRWERVRGRRRACRRAGRQGTRGCTVQPEYAVRSYVLAGARHVLGERRPGGSAVCCGPTRASHGPS